MLITLPPCADNCLNTTCTGCLYPSPHPVTVPSTTKTSAFGASFADMLSIVLAKLAALSFEIWPTPTPELLTTLIALGSYLLSGSLTSFTFSPDTAVALAHFKPTIVSGSGSISVFGFLAGGLSDSSDSAALPSRFCSPASLAFWTTASKSTPASSSSATWRT